MVYEAFSLKFHSYCDTSVKVMAINQVIGGDMSYVEVDPYHHTWISCFFHIPPCWWTSFPTVNFAEQTELEQP